MTTTPYNARLWYVVIFHNKATVVFRDYYLRKVIKYFFYRILIKCEQYGWPPHSQQNEFHSVHFTRKVPEVPLIYPSWSYQLAILVLCFLLKISPFSFISFDHIARFASYNIHFLQNFWLHLVHFDGAFCFRWENGTRKNSTSCKHLFISIFNFF